MRSCTNRRSIQIREPKLPVARRKIVGILGVFQDCSTRPAAILAAKLGAEAIGTASEDGRKGREVILPALSSAPPTTR